MNKPIDWGKTPKDWTSKAREVFEQVHERMQNQDVIIHPNADLQTPSHWETVAWNAAWLAADAVDGRRTVVTK